MKLGHEACSSRHVAVVGFKTCLHPKRLAIRADEQICIGERLAYSVTADSINPKVHWKSTESGMFQIGCTY
jgi:hypothetical protein